MKVVLTDFNHCRGYSGVTSKIIVVPGSTVKDLKKFLEPKLKEQDDTTWSKEKRRQKEDDDGMGWFVGNNCVSRIDEDTDLHWAILSK